MFGTRWQWIKIEKAWHHFHFHFRDQIIVKNQARQSQTKNIFVPIILKPSSVSSLFYHGTKRITKITKRSKESEINPVVLHRPLDHGRPKKKKRERNKIREAIPREKCSFF